MQLHLFQLNGEKMATRMAERETYLLAKCQVPTHLHSGLNGRWPHFIHCYRKNSITRSFQKQVQAKKNIKLLL